MSEDPGAEDWQDSSQAAESQPARRTPLLWAAVWLIVALVVVAVIALATSGGAPGATPTPSQPSTSSEPSAAASAPASSSARPSIGTGIGVDWTIAASFPGASVNDVTAGGPGWVAVGAAGPVGCEICPGIEEYSARIWTSTDGRTWDEVAVPNPEGSSMAHVAAVPDGLVAVRWLDSDPSDDQDPVVQQVLVSSDGVTWTPVSGTPFESVGTSISDLAGGSSFAAVGTTGGPETNGNPAAWTSVDGQNWHQGFTGSDVGLEGTASEVTAVEGGWLAVGSTFAPTGDSSRPFIPVPFELGAIGNQEWLGVPLPLPETAGGGAAQAVAETATGFVAVGYGEYSTAEASGEVIGFAAWHRSSEVGSWEAAPVTEDMLEDIGGGFLVYESPERVFAIGSGCRCGTGLPGRWWTSTDGLAWVQHAETPPAIHTVIPFGGGLLAAGIEAGEGAIFISE